MRRESASGGLGLGAEDIGAKVMAGDAGGGLNGRRMLGGDATAGFLQPVPDERLTDAEPRGQPSLPASFVDRCFEGRMRCHASSFIRILMIVNQFIDSDD